MSKKQNPPAFLYKKAVAKNEDIYNKNAIGWKVKGKDGKTDRDNRVKKVPFDELPNLAKKEVNLIRGGFFDSKTGEDVPFEKVRAQELRRKGWR